MGATQILLGEEVDRDAVDEAADALGWALVNLYARRQDRPRHVFYATPDGEGMVTLVEDHRIDARYLVISAHDADGVAAQARQRLPHLALDDVLARWTDDPVRATCWLAVVGASPGDERVTELVRRASRAEEPELRAAGCFAATALGWPELEGPEPERGEAT